MAERRLLLESRDNFLDIERIIKKQISDKEKLINCFFNIVPEWNVKNVNNLSYTTLQINSMVPILMKFYMHMKDNNFSTSFHFSFYNSFYNRITEHDLVTPIFLNITL